MITIMTAIQSLRPNAGCVVRDNAEIEWLDAVQTEPTQSEIDAEVIRLQAEYDSQAYARSRALEYPPATDYLDGIVKGDTAQVDKYIADCQAVKDKYPKE